LWLWPNHMQLRLRERVVQCHAAGEGSYRTIAARKASKSSATSQGTTTASAARPCLRAFIRERAFPSAVLAPVDASALAWFAAICFAVAMEEAFYLRKRHATELAKRIAKRPCLHRALWRSNDALFGPAAIRTRSSIPLGMRKFAANSQPTITSAARPRLTGPLRLFLSNLG